MKSVKKYGFLLLFLLCACSNSQAADQVENAVTQDVSHDFEELGEETEDAVQDDGKDVKQDETITGDFEDLA